MNERSIFEGVGQFGFGRIIVVGQSRYIRVAFAVYLHLHKGARVISIDSASATGIDHRTTQV